MVLDDHAGNTHTSHVSTCPFTVGCPTFGVDDDDHTTYCIHAGNVSVTVHGDATVPLLPYVIVYVTKSHDTTLALSTVFFDHRSIFPHPIIHDTAVPQLLLLKLLSSAIHTRFTYCPS